jgi:hypothetical protein
MEPFLRSLRYLSIQCQIFNLFDNTDYRISLFWFLLDFFFLLYEKTHIGSKSLINLFEENGCDIIQHYF